MRDPHTANPKIDGKASFEIRLFSGIVLAGGASRRMGRDKALIPINGQSLLAQQVQTLHAAGASEVIVVQNLSRNRPAENLPPGVRVAWDDPAGPEAGPLAGMVAGLAIAQGPWAAIAAVDLPHLTSRWWTKLLAVASPHQGVVGCHPNGHFEPLAALYPVQAREKVRQQLASGDLALQALIRRGIAEGWMQAMTLTDVDQAELENWNEGPMPDPPPIA